MNVISNKNFILFAALLMVAALMLSSCSNVQTEPDLTGKINSIQQIPKDEKHRMILVDSPGNQTSDKYVLTVTTETLIQRQVGKAVEPASFGNLQAGQLINVWLTGPVRDSYPAQADAKKIVIVE